MGAEQYGRTPPTKLAVQRDADRSHTEFLLEEDRAKAGVSLEFSCLSPPNHNHFSFHSKHTVQHFYLSQDIRIYSRLWQNG